MTAAPLELISVLPGYRDRHRWLAPDFRTSIAQAAQLADRHGYAGVLLHYNLHTLEPWALVPTILDATVRLTPIVAVQPNAAPPHSLARLIAALDLLHGRRIDINLIIGATPDELAAVGDAVDHGGRYRRAREFATILKSALANAAPSDFEGEFYRLKGFAVEPRREATAAPRVFVAGASQDAIQTAIAVGDVIVTHPEGQNVCGGLVRRIAASGSDIRLGIRVGIVARATTGQARAIGEAMFPANRAGRISAVLKSRAESHWVRALAAKALDSDNRKDAIFWLSPVLSGVSYAPYLVGSYTEVGAALGDYRNQGVSCLMLDGPFTAAEFEHVGHALAAMGEA